MFLNPSPSINPQIGRTINLGDNRYQITSPIFEEIIIQLDSKYYQGNAFKIVASNYSKENIYLQSVQLNGKRLERFYITHAEITNGGVLEMEMGPEPTIE